MHTFSVLSCDPANTAPQGMHHTTDQQSPSLGATVQGSVDAVVQGVIGLQDPQGFQSKNTFSSAAIPLSHRVLDKLKKQIWANELVDFALLLHNSATNPAEEQFTVKLDTSQEGQQSLVLVPSTKSIPYTQLTNGCQHCKSLFPFMQSVSLRTHLL